MNIGFRKKRTLVLSAAFATVIAIVCIAVFLHPSGKIAKGVFAGDTYLGGMSRDEAREAIVSTSKMVPENLFIYTFGGVGINVSGEEIGLSLDIEKTLDAAFSKGRSRNVLKNGAELIALRLVNENIGYIYSYDKERLSQIIYDFGVSVNGEHRDYILEYGEESVLVKRGVAGQERDVSIVVASLEQAIGHGSYNIFVKLKKEPIKMPNLRSLYDETYLEPKNATYEILDGKVILTPEVFGRKIDMQEAATAIPALRSGEPAELKLVPLLPEVTLEQLNNQLFNYTLAQFTTAYSQKDRGRSANVALAAKKIDGVVLAPGETFSFNEVVGPRTAAAGFSSAPVFENGETVQGLGGGVCQVSSTLYSAVLYADLEIVSRKNHSMTVAYVPKGQDATVSYGSIDFKFKNSTAYPIKILASASEGKMSVSIQGTKPEAQKTVKIVNNVVEEKTPTIKEIRDESLNVGVKKVLSSGKTGYTVTSSRIVYVGGNEIKNERLGTSVYKMVPKQVVIGAKLPQPTPTPAPAPDVVPEVLENEQPEEMTENVPPEELSGNENF